MFGRCARFWPLTNFERLGFGVDKGRSTNFGSLTKVSEEGNLERRDESMRGLKGMSATGLVSKEGRVE